jgi:hypothetical protein
MTRSLIAYHAELLPHGRAQLVCDVVIDDVLELSYPCGSPAPAATVVAHERTVDLNDPRIARERKT